MNFLVVGNRILWLALVLAMASYGLGSIWLAGEISVSPPEIPVAVPKPQVGALPEPAARALPAHNPFASIDQEGGGQPLKNATAGQAPPAASGAPATIQGVLRFSSFAGVFTPTGFVREGETLEGGTLKAVTSHGVTVELPHRKVYLPQPGGEKRLQGKLRITPKTTIRP
jgi:hypothetical protein